MPTTISGNEGADNVTPGVVLGNVGQSAGVPTGAIMESGSNANGFYVRWADGTQMCRWISATPYTLNNAFAAPITGSAVIPLNFPVPFVGLPSVIPAAQSTANSYAWAVGEGSVSTTSFAMRLLSMNATTTAYATYTAWGRWF